MPLALHAHNGLRCSAISRMRQRRASHWSSSTRTAPRRRPRLAQAGLQPEQLQEWDVVCYRPSPEAAPTLGRVATIDAAAGTVHIERLEEDSTNRVWLVGHAGQERVALAAVLATVAADYLQIVDPDRVSNPHGEHALEAYRVEGWQGAGAGRGSSISDLSGSSSSDAGGSHSSSSSSSSSPVAG